jgi:hypothetical protein
MRVVAIFLVAVTLGAVPASATTYISAEPIPSRDIVGDENLAKILSIGYTRLARWSERLLDDCHIVDKVIDSLSAYRAIRTVNGSNTRVVVAAGGFEGITDPSFVFTVRDSGPGAARATDITLLDNILGYVLNQGGTTQFSPDNPNAYDFPLDYAVVTFRPPLTGEEAKEFFDFLGTIDPALWSGLFAGFTQIDFAGSPTNNSMLFLQPDVTTRQFVTGLATAARRARGAEYVTVNKHGRPTTATAGVAFPGNDWLAFPNGDQYLSHLVNPAPQLLEELAALRRMHLNAVSDLVRAIDRGTVNTYLHRQLRCR